MANPTTAKPTGVFNTWVSTAGTVGELSVCYCVLSAKEPPRDVVGNVLGHPVVGPGNNSPMLFGGYGHPPLVVNNAFTGGGLSDPVYRFGAGTQSIRFAGRGLGNSANNQTVWAVFKPNYASTLPNTTTAVIFGTGSEGFHRGICIQVSTAGVITVGRYLAGFTSSTVTLTSGKTYLVSLTTVSSTSNLINVYCYDDQAYVTPSGTGTTFTVSAAFNGGTSDAVINYNPNFDGFGNTSFIGDIYACGLSTATFDPGTNGYFAALVADPCVAARGTYAGGGAMTAGGIVAYDETTSAITINCNRPSGGTPASYQFRLHRSTTPGFTPSAATRVTGLQSSPILVDTTATPKVSYCYTVEQTDGTYTVYSTTATSNQTSVWSRLSRGDFFFGVISDSRWSSLGKPAPQAFCRRLFAKGWRCGFINCGVGSTFIYNSGVVTLSWRPSTTGPYNDPVNGQAGATLLPTALSNFATAYNVNKVVALLGVNDSSASSVSSMVTSYGYIKNVVLTAGYTMYVSPPYTNSNADSVSAQALDQLTTSLAALDNGTTCKLLPTNSYEFSRMGLQTLAADNLHYQDSSLDGEAVADAVLALVDPSPRLIVVGG